MTLQEALSFLEISRASLYRVYIKPGRLTPIRNSALPRPRLHFRAADIYALRPDKAPPRLLAEDRAGYDPNAA